MVGNIRMDLKEIGINTRIWVDSDQDRDNWRVLVTASVTWRISCFFRVRTRSSNYLSYSWSPEVQCRIHKFSSNPHPEPNQFSFSNWPLSIILPIFPPSSHPKVVFISCRPFVVNIFSTCLTMEGLQERNTQLLDGTTVLK